MATSVAVLAEILLRLPQKLFIFILKQFTFLGQSIQNINYLILKKTSLIVYGDSTQLQVLESV